MAITEQEVELKNTLRKSWAQIIRTANSVAYSLYKSLGIISYAEYIDLQTRISEISHTGPQEYEGNKGIEAWQQARKEFFTKFEKKGLGIPKNTHAQTIFRAMLENQISSFELFENRDKGFEVFLRNRWIQQILDALGFVAMILTITAIAFIFLGPKEFQGTAIGVFFSAAVAWFTFSLLLERPWN